MRGRWPLAFASMVAFVASCSAATRSSPSRTSTALLQFEVSDSAGLPLPDARLELYARADRGLFREWLPIEASMLEEGIHLLRFSHPGYRSSVFSVPLREGGRVAVRVRLAPDTSERPRKAEISATTVRASGIATFGKQSVEVIAGRRVVERDAIEAADARSIGDLLRIANGTGLVVEPRPGGLHEVGEAYRSRRCVQVVVNGDPTLVLGFSRFEEEYRFAEAEAVEIVSRPKAIPYFFRRLETDCAMLLVWLSGRQL